MRTHWVGGAGRGRVVAATALALALVATSAVQAPVTDAEAVTKPSLRLLNASDHVTLRGNGKRVPLNLGVYAAATGGAFEVQVARADYRQPFTFKQVDAGTKAILSEVPPALAQGLLGFKRFARVAFTNREGKVVRRVWLPFCPNTYEVQRVDGTGPQVPGYPASCDAHFPFLKGTVWGIDSGWAAGLTSEYGEGPGPRSVVLPAGRYTVDVSIGRPFVRLFGIAPADRKVTLQATVKHRRPRRHSHGMARDAGGDPLGGPRPDVQIVAAPDPSTLPDLVALPAWAISLDHRRGRDLLGFATTPWNAGPAPLVVEGYRRPGKDVMDSYQYFFDADGEVVGRDRAGSMAYHDSRGHHHWHWLDFAAFSLLDANKQHVVRSRKQAFCIIPTDAVDLVVDRAALRPWETSLGTNCGGEDDLWVREVLPAGWGDTYFQSVAGQSFDVTDLPNGHYYIKVEVDPRKRLHQRDTANDVAYRRLSLRGTPGERRVRVSPWKGIDG